MRNREVILAGGGGGLGRACVEAFTAEGARVIVSYHRQAARAQALSGVAEVVQADLTVAADRRRLLDTAGRLYGLVVLAGVPARVREAGEFEDAARFAFEVNCLGPLALAREAAERMAAQETAGAIVLVSTMQARALFAGSTAYAVSKAGLEHGARILAKEMRGKNIRVNVIAPGVMAAGMAESSIASGKYDYFLEQGIVPRFGRAADLARTVRFLLEPDNYITGQILGVDGGATL